MIGARALLSTLVGSGVDVCFMNPGTSEMHFVAALDDEPAMRSVLTLFEGVATGAADGYARIAQKPAATLLHLGPGLGNGLANLHNARRARSPIVNIVGDHATTHQRYDAQLASDIVTVARNVSRWIATPQTADEMVADAARAVAAALGPPGSVATLVAPADCGWSDASSAGEPVEPAGVCPVDDLVVERTAAMLRDDVLTAVLIGGRACHGPALADAARIASAAGARIFAETFPARLSRGVGQPPVPRLAYQGDFLARQLDGIGRLILIDAAAPVAFFAYPGAEGSLVPSGCDVATFTPADADVAAWLAALAEAVDAPKVPFAAVDRPTPPEGELTVESVCQAIGALLPEHAIVSDESNTSGIFAPAMSFGAPPHDWLCLTGGSIGQGLPVALGAAIAAPDRRVVALEGDGSAMYTPQAWWSMARESADVTAVVFDNAAYAILRGELARVGAVGTGEAAKAMLELDRPRLDLVALAKAHGVPATRATTAAEFNEQFARGLETPGPNVVVATIPALL